MTMTAKVSRRTKKVLVLSLMREDGTDVRKIGLDLKYGTSLRLDYQLVVDLEPEDTARFAAMLESGEIDPSGWYAADDRDRDLCGDEYETLDEALAASRS